MFFVIIVAVNENEGRNKFFRLRPVQVWNGSNDP
jgi:hypothetical protein